MAPGAKRPPRCLIVDDHPVVRAGVRAVLEQAFDSVEITDAESIDQVADAARDGAKPDVVIIDPGGRAWTSARSSTGSRHR